VHGEIGGCGRGVSCQGCDGVPARCRCGVVTDALACPVVLTTLYRDASGAEMLAGALVAVGRWGESGWSGGGWESSGLRV